MKRKVLLLAMALELGGAETHVITLAQGLKEAGLEVQVMSAGGSLARLLGEAGIPHRPAPLNRRSPLLIAEGIRQVARAIREWQPHLLHAHARLPAWIAAQARKGTTLPLVITYHGLYRHTGLWRYVNTWGDAVVAISPEVRRHLVDQLHAPAEKVHVIPNGVDTRRFQPSQREPSGFHIVHVSRLDETIAPALALVEAVGELRASFPALRATIAGDGRQRAAVEEAARGKVAMAGALQDPLPLLQDAFAVVGAGRSLLEAMACGRPVVTTDMPGCREAVRQMDNGVLVAPKNIPALADAISLLLSDATLRARMGARGRERAETEFSSERVCRETLAVFDQLARRPS